MANKRLLKVRAVTEALIAGIVLPSVLGGGYMAVAVLLLPLAVSVLVGRKASAVGSGPSVGSVLTGCLAFMFLLPGSGFSLPTWLMVPVMVWLLGCGVYAALAGRLAGVRKMWYVGGLCAVTAVLLVTSVSVHYQGQPFDGLIGDLCAQIEGMPMVPRVRLLYSLYVQGLARLTGEQAATLAVSAKMLGVLGIPAEMQNQLLWSFRTTLEYTVPPLVPELLAQWGLATTLLSVAVGDAARKRGEREIRPFQEWHMPTECGRCALLLLALGMLPWFTVQPGVVFMGRLCSTLGYWAFAVQGLALLRFTSLENGEGRGGYLLKAVLLMVVLPLLLVISGIFDLLNDPRNLRSDKKS